MNQTSHISVALGPFEDIVMAGLTRIIEDDPSLELVGAFGGAGDAPGAVLAGSPASVLLINYTSPADASRVEALRRDHPEARIVVLAERGLAGECAKLLALGVAACLGKDTQRRDVITAIHLASRGMRLTPSVGAERRSGERSRPSDSLTPRESDVLDGLRQGRSNAEIASELQVSVETVRTHARRIYTKLGVSSRRDLSRAPGNNSAD